MFVEGKKLKKWVGSGFPNERGEVVETHLLRRTTIIIEEYKDLVFLSDFINACFLCIKIIS